MIFPYSFPAGAVIMLFLLNITALEPHSEYSCKGWKYKSRLCHPSTPAPRHCITQEPHLGAERNSFSWPWGLSSHNTPRLPARFCVYGYHAQAQFGVEVITYRIRFLNPEINCANRAKRKQSKQKRDHMVSMGASTSGRCLWTEIHWKWGSSWEKWFNTWKNGTKTNEDQNQWGKSLRRPSLPVKPHSHLWGGSLGLWFYWFF